MVNVVLECYIRMYNIKNKNDVIISINYYKCNMLHGAINYRLLLVVN